ncbi:hypothetical protein EUGRSUZ_C04265 [Eucalyptus grandis]|uniref:Uncharacterized protein n=3 Tax=Eucalyptus grandis TaxID=71139 RepID=A0A059CX09_EUCGR|nr:hypothetical protein EUGRSUZ_C04265 [Eucalyptus grandis]KAK3439417.1 hypothetical protein EUGRSUZ_C04265 [Eucalyptus grandis]
MLGLWCTLSPTALFPAVESFSGSLVSDKNLHEGGRTKPRRPCLRVLLNCVRHFYGLPSSGAGLVSGVRLEHGRKET